jgi:hypothetical protein
VVNATVERGAIVQAGDGEAQRRLGEHRVGSFACFVSFHTIDAPSCMPWCWADGLLLGDVAEEILSTDSSHQLR